MRMSRVSGSAASLSIRRVILQIPWVQHARLDADMSVKVASIVVRHVRHARFPRDTLATSS